MLDRITRPRFSRATVSVLLFLAHISSSHDIRAIDSRTDFSLESQSLFARSPEAAKRRMHSLGYGPKCQHWNNVQTDAGTGEKFTLWLPGPGWVKECGRDLVNAISTYCGHKDWMMYSGPSSAIRLRHLCIVNFHLIPSGWPAYPEECVLGALRCYEHLESPPNCIVVCQGFLFFQMEIGSPLIVQMKGTARSPRSYRCAHPRANQVSARQGTASGLSITQSFRVQFSEYWHIFSNKTLHIESTREQGENK